MGTSDKELFFKYLEAEDKDSCLDFVLRRLHGNNIGIRELYEEILAPALNRLQGCPEENVNCVWQEHLKTSIVRTIIECCYSFIARVKNVGKGAGVKVLVFCPENELHEIGARMVTDFFTLNGYNAIFIGANTPAEQIKAAIAYEKPRYVAISVTNYYNLVAAKKAIALVKAVSDNDVCIVIGGLAFKDNREMIAQMGADAYLETYEDITMLGEGAGSNETGI